MEDYRKIKAESQTKLGTIATWARLISILQFVGAALTLIQTIRIMGLDFIPSEIKSSTATSNTISIVVNVTLFLLLFKFGNMAKRYLESRNAQDLEMAYKHYKNYSIYGGILMIILTAICALAFIYLMTL